MKKTGFTLIELLIVIAIILILIAIALPNFLEAQIRARVAAVKGDLRTVSIGMDSYFLDFGMFPPDHDPSTLSLDERGLFQLTSPLTYLKELPLDKFNTGDVGLTGPGSEVRWFEMGSTGLDPRTLSFGFLRPIVHAYAVYSAGPDGAEGFHDNDDWPYDGEADPCPDRIGFVNYSPTNGTKSNGDIVQLGGEHRAGLYCIDRWMVVAGKRPVYPTP